jgi:hypothetical protein
MNTQDQLHTVTLCRAYIAKRPCLDWRNYFSDGLDWRGRAAYRSESRRITRQLNDARRLLRFCELYSVNLTAQLIDNSRRLFIDDKGELEYHVGQYWPTEYRAAVARAAASAIWAWWRDECGYDTGDKLRAKARAEFGRGIASRWFN